MPRDGPLSSERMHVPNSELPVPDLRYRRDSKFTISPLIFSIAVLMSDGHQFRSTHPLFGIKRRPNCCPAARAFLGQIGLYKGELYFRLDWKTDHGPVIRPFLSTLLKVSHEYDDWTDVLAHYPEFNSPEALHAECMRQIRTVSGAVRRHNTTARRLTWCRVPDYV